MLAGQKVLADDFDDLADSWPTWTPTLANLTLGSGSVIARRRIVGKTMDFAWTFTLGAGSAVGTGPTFTLDAALASHYFITNCRIKLGIANCSNAGIADYDLSLRTVSSATPTIVELVVIGTNGLHALVTATVPFTFGTGDCLAACGTVELA